VIDSPFLKDPILAGLAREPWYAGQIAHVEVEKVTAARHRNPAEPLADPLARYLESEDISLFTHQADALDRWKHGQDVLLATRTASGKTLAFNLCVAEALLANPRATALYLYPTKALSNDQVVTLLAFDRAIGLNSHTASYDGDTPQSQRARIRRDSRIIVSNPYGLHEYLAQPQALQSFWSNLAVVVIDEAHRYRGVFGSHVALVIRRLQRITERFGARPRFILASGTIANPAAHGADLIGRAVTVVDNDGGPRGQRTVVLWDSMADPDRAASTQAAHVLASLVNAGRNTICFTGSRVGAELIAQWAGEMAPHRRISPYRAGYQPAERREIEKQLRSGTLDGVVSTDALELGIDIGGLDAAVLAGYPGTVASTWQQIGRAGRAQQSSVGILIADEDPLDQYLIRRPGTLFGAPVERAVVALDNAEVVAAQVMCAAAELAVRDTESERFGPMLPSAIAGLEAASLLASAPNGHMFVGKFRPASAVRIDGRGDDSVEVRADGELVEIFEYWRALREAHQGAVLMHRGQKYKVTKLDLGTRTAEAIPIQTAEHTRSTVARDFSIGVPENERAIGRWRLALGQASVRSQVSGYKLMRHNEVVSVHGLDLPPVELDTRGLWLTLIDPQAPLHSSGRDLLGSLHAMEHAFIHTMPLLAMCDRGDAGGVSTLSHPSVDGPLILIYDGYQGGSGIVNEAFDNFDTLVDLTLDMVSSCDCGAEGCPRCCYSKLCGSDNQPMNRLGAIELLTTLRTCAPST
jgi:DEAD/DEAH box helicase domain-containing protein